MTVQAYISVLTTSLQLLEILYVVTYQFSPCNNCFTIFNLKLSSAQLFQVVWGHWSYTYGPLSVYPAHNSWPCRAICMSLLSVTYFLWGSQHLMYLPKQAEYRVSTSAFFFYIPSYFCFISLSWLPSIWSCRCLCCNPRMSFSFSVLRFKSTCFSFSLMFFFKTWSNFLFNFTFPKLPFASFILFSHQKEKVQTMLKELFFLGPKAVKSIWVQASQNKVCRYRLKTYMSRQKVFEGKVILCLTAKASLGFLSKPHTINGCKFAPPRLA